MGRPRGDYHDASSFEQRWRDLCARAGGRERIAGTSVEGRPLWAFELGRPDAPGLLLTALIHGVEVIGSVALLHILEELIGDGHGRDLLGSFNVVVLPIMNPDAFALNMDRLTRGWPVGRRTNARGVDLNRNFPSPGGEGRSSSWHPFAGSSWRWSPHYRGSAPFSEPETQALRGVVEAMRPALSLGFHSFGNLLVYPWAFCRQRNDRVNHYERLAASFVEGLPMPSYRLRQASSWYPTVGDLDDWLDASHGTLALTVEVGGIDRRVLHPARMWNPFWWMNPIDVNGTVRQLAPAARALLGAGVGLVTNPATNCRFPAR